MIYLSNTLYLAPVHSQRSYPRPAPKNVGGSAFSGFYLTFSRTGLLDYTREGPVSSGWLFQAPYFDSTTGPSLLFPETEKLH